MARQTLAAARWETAKALNCRSARSARIPGPDVNRPGGSAIDERTTRWPGYAVSQQERKRIEQVFGWGKTVGRIHQAMYRGLERYAHACRLRRTKQ